MTSNGPRSECQQANVTGPLEYLHQCRKSAEPFVLLSRSEVFDVSRRGLAAESDRRNPVSDAGKMLAVAEDAVLDYEGGYVLRVGDLLDEMLSIFEILEEPPPRFENRIMRPVCRECLDYLAETLPALVSPGSPERVFHVCPYVSIEVATVIFHKFGVREYDMSEGSPPVVPSRRLELLGTRIPNLIPFEDWSAYIRANRDNCHRRLFQ